MAPVPAEELLAIRRLMQQELKTIIGDATPRARIRIDGYRIRRSITGNTDPERPFEWNPWTTRRILGLEGVRGCLGNPRLSPMQAVRDSVGRRIRRVAEQEHDDALARWLAGLPVGSRALVEAEAVQWSTQLLTALDWSQISHPLIGADRCLRPMDTARVLVRGRVDVEIRTRTPNHGSDSQGAPDMCSALFLVMAGQPTASARIELGLPALTIALDERRHAVPSTVVGWWPQSGRALILPVDVDLLLRSSEAVSEAVRLEVSKRPRRINRRSEFYPPAEDSTLERAAS